MNRFNPLAQSAAGQRFSLKHAIDICHRVEEMEAQASFNTAVMMDALQELTEVLLFMDKHDETVFDQVMERDPMNTLERLATNAEVAYAVKIQVLHCLTMLLHNLTRVSSVYFLCSNNHLNRIIALDLDESDDELVSVYISFLKSLALRLNKDTIQLFFEIDTGAFPLFDKAVKLFSSPDSMVRTAARQIVVSVAHLKDERVAESLHYVLTEVYAIVAASIAQQVVILGNAAKTWCDCSGSLLLDQDSSVLTQGLCSLRHKLENIVDDLYYLNDLGNTPQRRAQEHLVSALKVHLLQPLCAVLRAELQLGNMRSEELNTNEEKAENTSRSRDAVQQMAIPAATALTFCARWVEINELRLLHVQMARCFFECDVEEGDALSEAPGPCTLRFGGVVGAVLRSRRIDLYTGALLFWIAMKTNPLSVMENGTDTAAPLTQETDGIVGFGSELLGPFLKGCVRQREFSSETKHEEVLQVHLRLATLLSLDETGCCNGEGGGDSTTTTLQTLLTGLYQLLQKPFAGSLSSLYLVLTALSRELSLTPLSPSALCHLEKALVAALKLSQKKIREFFLELVPHLLPDAIPPFPGSKKAGVLTEAAGNASSKPSDLVTCMMQLEFCDPDEAMFLALGKAWRIFHSDIVGLIESFNHRDEVYLLPLAPSLVSSACPFSWDGECPDGARPLLESSHDAHSKLVSKVFPLFKRAPSSIEEYEAKVLLDWLLLRRLLWSMCRTPGSQAAKPVVDPLDEAIKKVSTVQQVDSSYLNSIERMEKMEHASGSAIAELPLRSELVLERSFDTKHNITTPGCVVKVVFRANTISFVCCASNEMRDNSLKRVVLVADCAYVRATELYPGSFQVIIKCHESLNRFELCLVFRTAAAASDAAQHINRKIRRTNWVKDLKKKKTSYVTMKASTDFSSGQIILQVTKEVVKGDFILTDGCSIRHGTDFNSTIINHFLISTKPIYAGDEIVVNFCLYFYDIKKKPLETFVDPIVSGFRYLSENEKQVLYIYADEEVRKSAIDDGFVPNSSEGSISVVGNGEKKITVSNKKYEVGAVLFESTGFQIPFSTSGTVEVPTGMYLRLSGGTELMRHSCSPNLRLEVEGNRFRSIALRSIEEGEALTFNYLCMEWELSRPFRCLCSAYCCYGFIKGFRFLDREQQKHLLPQCSPAVLEKYHALSLSAALVTIPFQDNSLLTFNATRYMVAQQYIAAGTVLFQVDKWLKIEGNELWVKGIRIGHSCDANTLLFKDMLLTWKSLFSGDQLYLNFNLLYYNLVDPFICHCGVSGCVGEVKGFDALPSSEKARLCVYASDSVQSAVKSTDQSWQAISVNPKAMVHSKGAKGNTILASCNIPKDACILHLEGLVLPFRTLHTIFLGEGKHLLRAGGAQYIAHSCQPNMRVAVDPTNDCLDCFALEDIAMGSPITFNYLTTEWDMDECFTCACGSSWCFEKIQGYRHLSYSNQMRLWPHATAAIRSLLAQTHGESSVLATLDRRSVKVGGDPDAVVQVTRDLPSGTLLFECREPFQIIEDKIILGDVVFPHSCSPTAFFLQNRAVLCQAVLAGTVVTLNINQLIYRLPKPIRCRCGTDECEGEIAGFAGLRPHAKDVLLLGSLPEVRADAVADGYKNFSSCPLVDVRANGKMGQATFAATHIPRGTRFLRVTGVVLSFPTVYTILLARGKHLLFADGAQCLAHSCEPNVRVILDPETRSLDLFALRDIAANELISFNYLCTEWSMSTPFQCICGSQKCFGMIRGFQHLAATDRQRLWSMTTPVIRELAHRESSNWEKLSAPPLCIDDQGYVRTTDMQHEGLPLLSALHVNLSGNHVVVDEIALRHSCSPTAALIDKRVVLIKAVCPGTEITLDINCIAYCLEHPFMCNCGMPIQPHPVCGFSKLSEEDRAARMVLTELSVRMAALQDGSKVPCPCPLVEVRPHGKVGLSTFAIAAIAAGTRFLTVKGLSLSFPTLYTVMQSEDRHLLLADGAQCLAHSCEPNVRVRVDGVRNTLECEALRDIQAGEVISFNYNTTEWDMISGFDCLCGTPTCLHNIRGFKYLTCLQQQTIQPYTTPAIKELALRNTDTHWLIHLVKSDLAAKEAYIRTAQDVAEGQVLLEVFYLDVQPTQVDFGHCTILPHSNDSNCVLVEGRLVACKAIAAGAPLSININYFVYDMMTLFPHGYSECCKGFKHMDEALKQENLFLCEPPLRAQAMKDGWVVQSTQAKVEIRRTASMGQAAYATCDISVGTKLYDACGGLVVPFPTMYTIAVGKRRHLLFGQGAECIAHHCDPNTQVVVNEDRCTIDFVVIRPILENALVTFNYNTTEWEMNSTFTCVCQSPLCAGTIQGFKHLSDADQRRLWPITSNVVKTAFAKKE